MESSDLVANYPAASLSLANRVDLVGVLPFASAAARTTAIPSPTDGQYSYLQDTNSTEFYNGAAWVAAGTAPGLSIVTPTSIANSGGTATASGGQVTFSGVSSVSLNGVYNGTYDAYRIVIRFTGTSAGADIFYRNRLSGTDAATNYNNQSLAVTGSTVAGSRTLGSTSAFMGSFRSTGQSESWIDLYAPSLAVETGLYSSNRERDSSISFAIFGALHTTATAYDGFTFTPSAGTLTGTIRVYGYKNS